jgi:hypothetical protein
MLRSKNESRDVRSGTLWLAGINFARLRAEFNQISAGAFQCERLATANGALRRNVRLLRIYVIANLSGIYLRFLLRRDRRRKLLTNVK